MTVAPKERRRSPAWFPLRTLDPRLGEGRRRRTRARRYSRRDGGRGADRRSGRGLARLPARARLMSALTGGCVNHSYRSRTNPKAGAIPKDFSLSRATLSTARL